MRARYRWYCERTPPTLAAYGDRWCQAESVSWGGVKAQVYMYYTHDSLMNATANFPESDFGEVLKALFIKYGEPTETSQSTVRNGMGAEFTNETALWATASSYVVAKRYVNKISESSVDYYLKSWLPATQQRQAERAANSAKKL
ncbi:MAG: hypothetical protein ACR2OG_08455 [Gemmatimonadaceae bacterium]